MGRGKLAPAGGCLERLKGVVEEGSSPRPRGETFKRRVEVAWKREARPRPRGFS